MYVYVKYIVSTHGFGIGLMHKLRIINIMISTHTTCMYVAIYMYMAYIHVIYIANCHACLWHVTCLDWQWSIYIIYTSHLQLFVHKYTVSKSGCWCLHTGGKCIWGARGYLKMYMYVITPSL